SDTEIEWEFTSLQDYKGFYSNLNSRPAASRLRPMLRRAAGRASAAMQATRNYTIKVRTRLWPLRPFRLADTSEPGQRFPGSLTLQLCPQNPGFPWFCRAFLCGSKGSEG